MLPTLLRSSVRSPLTSLRMARRVLSGQELEAVVALATLSDGSGGRLIFGGLRTLAWLLAVFGRAERALPLEIVARTGLGNRQAGLRRIAEVLERTRAGGAPAVAIRVAAAAAAIGALTEARELLLAAGIPQPIDDVEALPQDPRLLLGIASVEIRSGNERRAVPILQRVLALEHRPGTARRAVVMLERAQARIRAYDPAWLPDPGIAGRPAGWSPVPGRILHLWNNALPEIQSGYTVRARAIADAQRLAGLDPMAATLAGFPASRGVVGAPRRVELDGLQILRLEPDLPPGTLVDEIAERTARGLAEAVREFRPSALQPTSPQLTAAAALAVAERFDIPVVYEVRGFWEETWASKQGPGAMETDRYLMWHAAETARMAAATAVVTLSETMKAEIVARGIPAEKVTVVPNGVDVDAFVPGARDEHLAARYGLPVGVPVIGYISSFVEYEGIPTLIEAAAILRDRGRDFRLLLVGDGADRPRIDRTIERLGLADRTVATGRVPHAVVADHHRLIDVFVVPRTGARVCRIVTPLKPYEAMALERALVVSDVEALREIVEDGETGRVATPEDPMAFADAIEPLLDDPAERARLGRNARHWVAEHRTWAEMGRRYRALADRLGFGPAV